MLRIKTFLHGFMCIERKDAAAERQVVELFKTSKRDKQKNKKLKFNHLHGIFNHPMDDIISITIVSYSDISNLIGWKRPEEI